METRKGMADLTKTQSRSKKGTILLIVLLFTIASATAGFFYIHRLETTFLNNVQFYLDEIARHDTKSVDQEIEKQWEKLGVVGKKLALESFQNEEELQFFLNMEMEATGFEKLMLLDDRGNGYEANYLISSIKDQEWAARFLEQKKPFVAQNQMRSYFIVRDNSLLCGVPIPPLKIGNTTFVGVVGSYRMVTVKESLQVRFFDGLGLAQVVGRDGTIITTEITQRGEPLENLLDQLEGGRLESGDSYESMKNKLSAGESFQSVYTYGGNTTILTARPLDNADWMVVVKVPLSVASNQTAAFLKITALAFSALCVVIAAVLIFAFISYKRTVILKNSRQIFYRERLFNLLAMHTDDVFAIINPYTDMTYFISENVERILGISVEAGMKVNLSLFPEELRGKLKRDVNRLLSHAGDVGEHERAEAEFEWLMPDGKSKWIHVAVYTAQTDILKDMESCLIIVLSDYTQVKENQRKLENAIEQARGAAQSKSMFLSNMSHEMRTPLNGIIGCLSLMRSHLESPADLREYLRKAENTSRYLVSLVSDILDMSKIENHMLKLEEREVHIQDICSNAETMFRSRMEEKGIRFLVDLGRPLWVVLGDEVRIQQVLTNLLSNALKFTDQGGTVSLSIGQEPAGENMVKTVFSVSDTGVGMSMDFLARIWKPFEQERLDTARLHGGTGLGLAISHELTELMGGAISVTSEIGRGSVFTVELVQEALRLEGDGSVQVQEMSAGSACGKALNGRTILVAEDNELNREILVALLEDKGARVFTAVNGAEAVMVVSESGAGEIDAVLMDMQMPVMDGCEASRRIRTLDRADAGSIIIVACTANAFQEDIDRVKGAGMNEHIAKPLDMDKLCRILEKLWRERDI